VRVKLDENLPAELVEDLRARGHDVATVDEEDLSGASDPVVASAARGEGRILFTLDKGLADVRPYPPSRSPGVVLFRSQRQGAGTVRALVLAAVDTLAARSLAGRIAVVTPGAVRIRR
jgi:predicted nuclease of predicted toxin-antitoxin system